MASKTAKINSDLSVVIYEGKSQVRIIDNDSGKAFVVNADAIVDNDLVIDNFNPPEGIIDTDLSGYALIENLSTVATSGDYADLTNKPTIPSDISNLTDSTNLLFDKNYNSLSNKPTIPADLGDLTDTGNLLFSKSYTDLTNKPTSFSNLSSLSLEVGITAREFSNDITLADNSQEALVTEYAVRNYVQNNLPTSITDLNITDGTIGQVLTTNGAGTFSFQDPGDQIGNFTLAASVIDTDDSSAITIVPAVVVNSDLTVENNLTVSNDIVVAGIVTASSFVSTGSGDPEFSSATDITFSAAERVTISSSPLKFASFTSDQRDTLTAENGDVIYNSTTNKFQGYAAGSWVDLH